MISVIVPVYNEERAVVSTLVKLSEALKGLGEHEIICVNDGSTDSSLEKIKSSGIPRGALGKVAVYSAANGCHRKNLH